MSKLIKCKTCGKEFRSSLQHKKYCSKACSPYYKTREVASHICHCLVCGTEIRTFPSQPRKFCSVECKKTYITEQSRVMKTCEYCGNQYSVISCRAKTSRFCSNKCRLASKRKYPAKLITCKNCGKEFWSNFKTNQKSYAVFCSRKCWIEYGWVTKVCLQCGAEFRVKRSKAIRRKYCSRKCAGMALCKRLTFHCDYCGKKVERSPSQYHAHDVQHHFCSLDCAHKYIDGDDPKWFTVNCEYCGEEIQKPKSSIDKHEHHFCSTECYDKWQVGPNSSNWRGGTSREPYGFDFDEEKKNKIRERDNWTCQICKEQIFDTKELCVHHINYLKAESQDFNLIALCRSCHAKTNFNRDEWQALLTDHMREHGFA